MRGPQAAGAAVPILFRLQIRVLGHVRRQLRRRHDRAADVIGDQGIADVLALADHVLDQERGLLDRVGETFAEARTGKPPTLACCW